MILWNFWLCDSMKDSSYVCIWTCSVFILPKEYWWIGCGRPGPKFCYGSFGDILFWFLRGHSSSGIGRTSTVHRWNFLSLETSMQQLIFCSVQSGSVCNLPILSGNIIYTGLPIIRLSDLLLYALCIFIHYLLSVVLMYMLTL